MASIYNLQFYLIKKQMSQINQKQSIVLDTKHLELDQKLHHITDDELYEQDDSEKPCWESCKNSFNVLIKKIVDYFEFDRIFSEQLYPKLNTQKCYKRYNENYDETYSERQIKFAYSFDYVLNEKIKEERRKKKNFWEELYRFICCESGNQTHDIDESYVSEREYRKIVKKQLLQRKQEFLTLQKEQIQEQNKKKKQIQLQEQQIWNDQMIIDNSQLEKNKTDIVTKKIKINRIQVDQYNIQQNHYFMQNNVDISGNVDQQNKLKQNMITPKNIQQQYYQQINPINIFDYDGNLDITDNYSKNNYNKEVEIPNMKYFDTNSHNQDQMVIFNEKNQLNIQIESDQFQPSVKAKRKRIYKQSIDTIQTNLFQSKNASNSNIKTNSDTKNANILEIRNNFNQQSSQNKGLVIQNKPHVIKADNSSQKQYQLQDYPQRIDRNKGQQNKNITQNENLMNQNNNQEEVNRTFAKKNRKNRIKIKQNTIEDQLLIQDVNEKQEGYNHHNINQRNQRNNEQPADLQVEHVTQKKKKQRRKLNHPQEQIQDEMDIELQNYIEQSVQYKEKFTNPNQHVQQKKKSAHLSIIYNQANTHEINQTAELQDIRVNKSLIGSSTMPVKQPFQAQKKKRKQKTKKNQQKDYQEEVIQMEL